MPWVRLDDEFADHPKIVSAGPLAAWLFVSGLCYCNRLLTDGFVPMNQVPRLVALDDALEMDPMVLANRLCGLGLWSKTTKRGVVGYLIHDFLKYQPSRKQILWERAKAATRQERFRNGLRNDKSNAVTNGGSNTVINASVTPSPFPIPIPEEKRESPRENPKTLSLHSREEFDRVYGVYPNKDRKEQANRAWVELWPSNELASTIYADIVRRKQAGWVKLERRFIPHLATYLRDRMWEDGGQELEPVYSDDNPDPEKVRHAWSCKVCGKVHEGTRAQRGQPLCVLDAIPK